MERATQHELRLARRMSRLGTETAFEVLNKARALERQGRTGGGNRARRGRSDGSIRVVELRRIADVETFGAELYALAFPDCKILEQ